MNPDRSTSPTPPDSNAHSVEFFEKLRSFLESTDENSSPSQRKSSDGEARRLVVPGTEGYAAGPEKRRQLRNEIARGE